MTQYKKGAVIRCSVGGGTGHLFLLTKDAIDGYIEAVWLTGPNRGHIASMSANNELVAPVPAPYQDNGHEKPDPDAALVLIAALRIEGKTR